MGKAIARKDGVDLVQSPHGTGYNCLTPTVHATDEGSDNVFIGGVGVVREGDRMQEHMAPGCVPHSPVLTEFSGSLYANGKRVGRVGDSYEGHIILTGSSNISAGD